MSDETRDQYRIAADAVAAEVQSVGFKMARGRDELSRSRGAVTQRLAFSLRQPHGAGVGYVEVFPGFNFVQLEALAADLQGKKPRPGFLTCSLNVGLLMPAGSAVEWRLGPGADPAAVTGQIAEAIRTFAVPFWDEFCSLPELLVRYDAGDRRVCRGAEWPWRRVAACVLLGDTPRAASLLEGMLATAHPATRPAVERALHRLAAAAAR